VNDNRVIFDDDPSYFEDEFRVSSFRFQVPSFRFQVSSFRFQVPSFKFQVPGSFVQNGLLIAGHQNFGAGLELYLAFGLQLEACGL
jgi:hypothetical protein